MSESSKTKQINLKKISGTDWFDQIWLQKNILKQLNFLRKMIYLYLEITGLLSKFIDRYQEKDKRYSFIELGCAASSFLPYIDKKYNNLRLFGIDKSLIGCKLATIKNNDTELSANIICGDILKSPIKPEEFDIVFILTIVRI